MKLVSFWSYLLGVFVACVLIAYGQRGYFAIGGEWLIPCIGIWWTVYVKVMEKYVD